MNISKGMAIVINAGALDTPGGGFSFPMQASNFFLYTASENLNIRFYDDEGQEIGGGDGLPAGYKRKGDFSRFQIATASGGAGTAFILFGDDDIDINTTTGTVNVLDSVSMRNRALGGSTFAASVAVAASAGGFPSQVMLTNPAASTKNLIVWGVRGYVNSAGGGIMFMNFVGNAVELTNDVSGNIVNKEFGSATASVAKLSWDNTHAAVASTTFERIASATAGQDDDWSGALEGPIVIKPGFSLVVLTATTNTQEGISFDWDEQ